jgi:antitoxin component of MazEF toxin-antitoxin module
MCQTGTKGFKMENEIIGTAEVVRDGSHMLLVFPKELAARANLGEGSNVAVSIQGNALVIHKLDKSTKL